MYCFNCGKLLSDNANFCSGCGAKQNSNANVVVSSNRETTEMRSRLRNVEIMLESGQFQNAFRKTYLPEQIYRGWHSLLIAMNIINWL